LHSPSLPHLEFLITELALASHSIPSLTLSSASLLSPVLESHPPSAIVVEGNFLSHALELIYELNELGHHLVIVVGETDEKVFSQASQHIKLARWNDLEAQGKAAPPVISPAPGCRHLPSVLAGLVLLTHPWQDPTMYLPSRFTGTPTMRCEQHTSLIKILLPGSLPFAHSSRHLRLYLLWTLLPQPIR